MAYGWAEFLREIRGLAAEGPPNHEATWRSFQLHAEYSERAGILRPIVRIGNVLPDRERFALAVSVTAILAPLEWPSEWIPARLALVPALDALVEESNPEHRSSLFLLRIFDGDDRVRVAHAVFYAARDLLRRPCRRDELRTVALLCNTGIALCRHMYARSTYDDVDASLRFEKVFMDYVEAADELNNAVGAVLFEGLHAPLEAGL